MSLTTSEMTPADIAACTGNCNNNSNGWGGDWGAWIIVFLIFAAFGWGGNGGFGGFGGNNASGALTRADLCQDMNFQELNNAVRSLQSGLCDGFYAQNTNLLTGFDRVTNNTNQGFAGLNTALTANGYENRLAINGLSSQLASCCCDIREGISGVNYNMATQSNAIQRQISDCCCETQRQIERGFCDTNYNLATQSNNTIQAIDKVGDRIIDYLVSEKTQSLRDENQALRLAASQQAQNNYLVNQLKPPCPIPAYITCNPYSTCNCNNGYNNSYNNCGNCCG